MKLKKQKQKKGILESKIFLFLVLIVMAFLINASLNMYSKSKEAKEYLDSVQGEYSSLESQYNLAKADLHYLSSVTGKEKEIRSKFDVGREGEKAVLIIEEDLPKVEVPKKKNILQKMWDWASF